jgi:hypothetical protein
VVQPFQTAAAPHFGLRPGPPPEPIAENAGPWYAFLVLGFLVVLLLVIRYRSRRIIATPEMLFAAALRQANDTRTSVSERFACLVDELRAYLERMLDPQWGSLTGAEAKTAWEHIFSANDQHFAQTLTAAWSKAESIKFGHGQVEENDLCGLIDACQSLVILVAAEKQLKRGEKKDEKRAINRTISQVPSE